MIKLELGEQDARDLRAALSIRLVGMREELVHTDDREYRAYVRATIDRLERVLQRLEQATAAPGAPGG